jgi:hypothetical protein
MTNAVKCGQCGHFGEPDKEVFVQVDLMMSNPKAWDYMPSVTPVCLNFRGWYGCRIQRFDLCENCFKLMMEPLDKK